MSIHSIYSPQVRAEALRWGITDLQAYRRLKAAEHIWRSEAVQRRERTWQAAQSFPLDYEPKPRGILERIFSALDRKIPADWNKY